MLKQREWAPTFGGEVRRIRDGGKRVDTYGFYHLTPVSLYLFVWRRPETGDRSEIWERQRIFSSVGAASGRPFLYRFAVPDSLLLHMRFSLRRRDTR